jgi:peptidoglycan/xylan/chitin deacetylase (PgdA/CDA1 family)
MSISRFLYVSFSKAHVDTLVWKLDAGHLRILCYHGVCEDHVANQRWVPECFVTESAFERQLRYLTSRTRVLPLSEALDRLWNGSIPKRAVSVTFDDGYANNLQLAYPLLNRYGVPATIFLSTSYIESGEFFLFLKSALFKHLKRGHTVAAAPASYKTTPIDDVRRDALRWWPEVRASLNDVQLQTLRPLSIADVKSANTSLLEFGAHSHTHCILKNETPERRRQEILTSIRKVEEWTSKPVRVFAYPNGELGDFGEVDKEALREAGILAAVSGIGGANALGDDPLELRRYPVALHHDEAGFRAEVTGFRTTLLRARSLRT